MSGLGNIGKSHASREFGAVSGFSRENCYPCRIPTAATAQKLGRGIVGGFSRRMRLRALIAGLAAGLAAATAAVAAQDSPTAITCTNPASGASWQIIIDYGKSTVDANPARLSSAQISWFDRKDGGNYTLDRKSGALTASVASSTGGYFRYGRCGIEQAR
jgi:hypothetical protein